MSDYKMVPVVPTEAMIRAGCRRAKTSYVYDAMLSAAPPFVVTDEAVEKAFAACNAAYEAARNEGYVIEHSAKAGVRAAIEAVLGGGV